MNDKAENKVVTIERWKKSATSHLLTEISIIIIFPIFAAIIIFYFAMLILIIFAKIVNSLNSEKEEKEKNPME